MLGNSFGHLFKVYAAGESYGEAMLIIVDGVPPGIALTEADIQPDLDRRRPGTSHRSAVQVRGSWRSAARPRNLIPHGQSWPTPTSGKGRDQEAMVS